MLKEQREGQGDHGEMSKGTSSGSEVREMGRTRLRRAV